MPWTLIKHFCDNNDLASDCESPIIRPKRSSKKRKSHSRRSKRDDDDDSTSSIARLPRRKRKGSKLRQKLNLRRLIKQQVAKFTANNTIPRPQPYPTLLNRFGKINSLTRPSSTYSNPTIYGNRKPVYQPLQIPMLSRG